MKYNILILVLLLYGSVGARLLRGGIAPGCQPCSADECCRFQCATSVPYVCTNGIAMRGCNGEAAYWPATTDCLECCDRSHCDPFDDCPEGRVDPSCEQECSDEVCSTHSCSIEYPFVCTEGGTVSDATQITYGCNNDPYYWLEKDDSCTSCCDWRMCQGRAEPSSTPEMTTTTTTVPTCEQECSEEVCATHSCSIEHPFVCTEGGTASDATQITYGCNNKPDYWLRTDQNCKACCDWRMCQNGGKAEPPTTPDTTTSTTNPTTTSSTTPATPTTTTTTKPSSIPCGAVSKSHSEGGYRHHHRH